jgi:predicted membrane channel-forming protein YqfA (hemolysin III family)
MGESLLVIWTSAMRRVKVPFFIGFGFSVLNIVAQLIVLVNVYDINRWLVILGTGLLLIATGVYVERKRENIIDTAHVWKEALATWQ